MPVTSLGIPYPALTDPPDGASQMQAMAAWVDAYLVAQLPAIRAASSYTDVVVQTTAVGDFGGGAMTDLVTCPGFTIPAWARGGGFTGWVTAEVTGTIITSSATFELRQVWRPYGGSTAVGTVLGVAGLAGQGISVCLPAAFDMTGVTSFTPVVQASRVVGTGALRINSGTDAGGIITWRLLIKPT